MSFYTQFFIRPYKHPLLQQPAGSFLMDENGGIQSSSLPMSVPQERLRAIADKVFEAFAAARRRQIVFTELCVDYAALRLRAKQGPRGTMVYVTRRSPQEPRL